MIEVARCRAVALVTGIVVSLAIVPACTANAPTAAPTGSSVASTPSPSASPGLGTLPPHGSFVTSIVRQGLVDPVAVAGEPHRTNNDPRAPAVGAVNLFPLTVTFPEDWRDRSLVICGWTPADGFYECKSMQVFKENGTADLGVPVRQPHDTYELWLLSSDTSTGLRRLLAMDTSSVAWPLHTHFPVGFESVNDVLTKQPPVDGNYLVAD